jgi:hypothetical protein
MPTSPSTISAEIDQHNQFLQWPVSTRAFVAGFARAMTVVTNAHTSCVHLRESRLSSAGNSVPWDCSLHINGFDVFWGSSVALVKITEKTPFQNRKFSGATTSAYSLISALVP